MTAQVRQLFGGLDLVRDLFLGGCRCRFLRRGSGFLGRGLAAGLLASGCPPFRRPAGVCGAGIKQHNGLVERDGVGRLVGRQSGVHAVVAGVRAVATVLDHDRPAFIGMIAQYLAGIGAEAATAARIGLLLRDQGHGAVETDAENIVAGFEIGVDFSRASRTARNGRHRQ